MLVSIIVPIYRVEKYLCRCIESLLKQTYDKIEILLIDDGSDDSSGEICDRYAAKYNNVFSFHQSNQGISSARNLGMEKAKGTYLTFVDADDYVCPTFVETLLQTLTLGNSQLSIAGITHDIETYENSINKPINEHMINKFQSQYVLDHIFSNDIFMGYVCNKIFLCDVIRSNNITFRKDIRIWEDLVFVCEYLKKIDYVSTVDKIIYYYENRTNSAVNSLSLENEKTKITAAKTLVQLGDIGTPFFMEAQKRYVKTILYYFFLEIKNGKLDKDNMRLPLSEVKEIKSKCKISAKENLKYYLLKYIPGIVCKIYNFRRN